MNTFSKNSIERGYFVFTLMPSLYCKFNCSHCYLTDQQRKSKERIEPDQLKEICKKLDAYWEKNDVREKTIICYWYGGEPTSQGTDWFLSSVEAINRIFTAKKGYSVKHTVLTSLLGVKDEWFDIFDQQGGGEIHTSYDGLMRGNKYVQRWEKRVLDAKTYGLKVSTISVINKHILEDGAVATLEYLTDLGVKEASFLPFMLNERNLATGKYNEFAPTMNNWSEFMIQLMEHWISMKSSGKSPPQIGQTQFILGHYESNDPWSINPGQTLFLMPNGDFVLPDYKNGWTEYMQTFGNIFKQDFAQILTSPERRKYMRKQIMKNNNSECLNCEHKTHCVMEFWKSNKADDECFGGKKFVKWCIENKNKIGTSFNPVLY